MLSFVFYRIKCCQTRLPNWIAVMGSKRWKKRPLKGSCPSLLELMETRKILTQVGKYRSVSNGRPYVTLCTSGKEKENGRYDDITSSQANRKYLGILCERGWASAKGFPALGSTQLFVCGKTKESIQQSQSKRRGRPHEIIWLTGNLYHWPGQSLVRLWLVFFFN